MERGWVPLNYSSGETFDCAVFPSLKLLLKLNFLRGFLLFLSLICGETFDWTPTFIVYIFVFLGTCSWDATTIDFGGLLA